MAEGSDRLFIGTRGHVAALDAGTGKELWSTKLPHHGFAQCSVVSLRIDGGHVFAGYAGYVYCLDASEGSVLWTNALPGMGLQPVVLALEGDDTTDDILAAVDQLRRSRKA